MVLTCSPQQDATSLHFPSPSHLHHLDATSTLIQLRRSLSRSPSKSPAFRLVNGKTTGSPTSPLSPSPLSPIHAVDRLQVPSIRLASSNSRTPSPAPPAVASEFPLSVRALKQPRKFSPLRPSPRAYTMIRPHSSKRILCESSDSGNGTRVFGVHTADRLDNTSKKTGIPASVVESPEVNFTGFGRENSTCVTSTTNENIGVHLAETSQPPQGSFNFRSDRRGIRLSDAPMKSSPLKRTDAPSKTDASDNTSPSAKRRSLHGASDLTLFDQVTETPSCNHASSEAGSIGGLEAGNAPTSVSKRSGSLRKSTVHQRQERPMLSRAKGNSNLAHEFNSAMPLPVPVGRMVPDGSRNALPTRRSLFAAEQAASNTLLGLNAETTVESRSSVRHPLSRTITQSSSGSDVAQDSPTHVPARAVNRRHLGAFARSLPIGFERTGASLADSSVAAPEDSTIETPSSYKFAKPLQTAFHSTGLISKRTRDIRQDSSAAAGSMPDTPCKRPMPANPMAPNATPAPPPRHAQLRRNVHAFGAPSTPFNPSTARPTPGANGQGRGIFGSTVKPLNRRGSFLSVESDENVSDCPASQAVEFPATPSKFAIEQSMENLSSKPETVLITNQPDVAPNEFELNTNSPKLTSQCKFPLSCPNGEVEDAEIDNAVDESPSTQRCSGSIGAMVKFSGCQTPSIHAGFFPSLHKKPLILSDIRKTSLQAETSPPVSPAPSQTERNSPHTPKDSQDAVAPPDPSGLSISTQAYQPINFRQSGLGRSFGPGVALPATPTTNRDSSRFQSHRLTQSSAHAIVEAQLDPSLTSRFDEIEMIGDGEFSSVFKVVENVKGTKTKDNRNSYFGTMVEDLAPVDPDLGTPNVYAVKKSRNAYLGQKDRAQKLKEVDVLRSLGHSEHTVQLLDHWEYASHLYIKTEFCEEGSLDKFLVEAGQKARLDDFRIWKIMIEVGKGLKHIHDCGFMHLDLKPANVLVTFDGALKIADFGMATSWPAAPGTEAEGDREYIGPEILTGDVDKPADIFALGLIVFEIAGNVVLPDNGASWQRLRQGDISDVPSLTSSSDISVRRNSKGMPLDGGDHASTPNCSIAMDEEEQSPKDAAYLRDPPRFMVDSDHPQSLEHLVTWMINPKPKSRPTVEEVLDIEGCNWVDGRRRAAATIYEGNWGPDVDGSENDTEMMDV